MLKVKCFRQCSLSRAALIKFIFLSISNNCIGKDESETGSDPDHLSG